MTPASLKHKKDTVLVYVGGRPGWYSTKPPYQNAKRYLLARVEQSYRLPRKQMRTHGLIQKNAQQAAYGKPKKIILFAYNFLPVHLILSVLIQDIDKRHDYYVYMIGSYVGNLVSSLYLLKWLEDYRITWILPSLHEANVMSKVIQQKNIAVLPYIEDYSAFEKIAFQRKSSRANNTVHFIYAGRIVSSKQLHTLIRFLHRSKHLSVRDWSLTLVGDPDTPTDLLIHESRAAQESYYEKLQVLVKKLGLTKQVHFHPSVKRSKLAEFYTKASIFVSLSLFHYDEFGFSPREALAAGLPCLLSNWGGYGDLKSCPGVHLVNVDFKDGYLTLNEKSFQQALHKSLVEYDLRKPNGHDSPKGQIKEFASPKYIHKRLQEILAQRPSKLRIANPMLREMLLNNQELINDGWSFPVSGQLRKIYRQIYYSYAGDK